MNPYQRVTRVCEEERPMTFNMHEHHRRSVRLKEYDYSQEGAYFVTICTLDHALLLENDGVRAIVEQCWLGMPDHFPTVQLDEWVIMPNHLHGIITVTCRGVQLNAPTEGITVRNSDNRFSMISPPRRNTLPVIIRTYKAAVSTLCRRAGYEHFKWQRGYYEHVIRTEDELNRARQYILDNPLQWHMDENNPSQLLGKSDEGAGLGR
jgi:hypothetical protein